MTVRLYYDDAYLTAFTARVIETAEEGRRVYLDRTAFYPSSGGQPNDTGLLGGARVVDVVDEGSRIAHLTERPVEAEEVTGEIDWPRRWDHMQQHTGQHLLSAVFARMLGAGTVSFHLGQESSTIDLDIAALSPEDAARVERRANELAASNLAVSVSYQEAGEAEGLRKPSEREGVLRVVSIADFDRSACGGTHARATGEIGPVLIRKLDKIRGNVRVEFLCGLRAVARARADFQALQQAARLLSSTLDEVPALVGAQIAKLAEAEKARRKLAIELAASNGREMYGRAAAGGDGVRRHEERIAAGGIDDAARAMAQGFCAGARAVFLVVCQEPPSVLVVASADSGVHAGNVVKAAVSEAGGRGGGNAQVAQGSVPRAEALPGLIGRLREELGFAAGNALPSEP